MLVRIDETKRVNLGIPVRSEKRYSLRYDHCWVDSRCLRRYQRKAKCRR